MLRTGPLRPFNSGQILNTDIRTGQAIACCWMCDKRRDCVDTWRWIGQSTILGTW